MRDLSMLNRTDLRALKGHDRDTLAVQRDKLHLERFPVLVHVHNGAHIAGGKLLSGQVRREHDTIEFTNLAYHILR